MDAAMHAREKPRREQPEVTVEELSKAVKTDDFIALYERYSEDIRLPFEVREQLTDGYDVFAQLTNPAKRAALMEIYINTRLPPTRQVGGGEDDDIPARHQVHQNGAQARVGKIEGRDATRRSSIFHTSTPRRVEARTPDFGPILDTHYHDVTGMAGNDSIFVGSAGMPDDTFARRKMRQQHLAATL